ncbi:MAG TPA: UbiA family prenyltransferase [Solirubrobacterales bacterium]|jgi:4-hydroxybenzoate polyprenyltransferase
MPAARDVAELVRLPAVLSVPGDALVGAAASGQLRRPADMPRALGLSTASACLYLAGMALNDYADRELDARERPERPIPSGRVSPGFALGLAGALTAAGAAAAVAADGRRALAVALPLAGAVWAYDLVLKPTPAGPVGMSACRALDVLLGAGPQGARAALPQAAVVGAHTATVTALSRHEVHGASERVGRAALAGTAAVALGAAVAIGVRSRSALGRVAGAALLAAYASSVGSAQAEAARDPSPGRVKRAVGAGIMGLMPLEGGLLAGSGAVAAGAAVASLWPLAKSLARRRAVT